MKAVALLEPFKFELQERPVPKPGEGEALVKVRAVGICGTDMHAFTGHQPFIIYPRVLGHEVTGEVAELGPNASGVAVGDRVCVDLVINCGHCYPCRIGRPNTCVNIKVMGVHVDGGFSEYIVASTSRLYKVPDELPDAQAAIVETLTIGCQGVARGEVTAADTVTVIGSGPIGLVCLLAAKARGAKVMMSDLVESRLNIARELGADATANTSKEPLSEAVARWTNGEGSNVVIEAVGVSSTIEAAIDVTSHAGRMVLLGIGTKPVSILPSALVRKEMDIRASRMNSRRFPEALALAAKNLSFMQRLVTHEMELSDTGEAFALLKDHPDITCKVVLKP